MESSQLDVRIRRRRQQLATLCLAASAVIGSTLLCPSSAAVATEPVAESSRFLLPLIRTDTGLGLDAERYLVPAERKFVRLSKTLISLPDDNEPDDNDGEEDVEDEQDQRRFRLRRLNIDDDESRDDADRDDEEDSDDQDDSDADEGMSAALTIQRIAQDEGGRFKLPLLAAPSTATGKIGNGKTPDGFRGDRETPTIQLAESGEARQLDSTPWAWSVSHWSAANTYSHPRYFEDRMLERHGHERFPAFQPMVSGARFFATVPMLPYLMTLSHPCDCESTLGYFRSGSCAPILHQQPPWDQKAALVEAAAVASVIAIFP